MNLSLEGFERRLHVDYIDKKIPFKAYWHPEGYGILRTGPVEYIEGFGVKRKTKTRVPSKTLLAKWDKNVEKLRHKSFTGVYTVEFDGENIVKDGGLNL